MVRQRLQLEPILITGNLNLKLPVRIDNLAELGADRIVNSIAAVERYGSPVIVIDLGTAATFDVIAADGAYIGGAIAPGLVIALEALAGRTALLPSVALTLPVTAIGRTTVTQMQSGLVCGYLAMLEGMIDRIRGELGSDAPVVITGGYAETFANASSRIAHFDRDLTLDGLRLAFERLQRE
jgi:type III pantothenate kinase